MWKSVPAEFVKTLVVIAFAIAVIWTVGCSSAPKPKAPTETRILSIIELTKCGNPIAVIVVTSDGAVNVAPADELSKEQMEGIDAEAMALPEGSAGKLDIPPCIPSQKTSL